MVETAPLAPSPVSSSPVSIARHGAIAVVTIASPPVNALSRPVRQGLLDAARMLAVDPTVTAVVLTGSAGRFVAGADLREMDRPPDAPFLPEVVAAIAAIAVPVIALLDGPALGGGFEIALACDLRLASPRASVGLTETRLGLVPGAGGTQRITRLTGVATAIPLVCEGRIVAASEAAILGLVDAVIDGDLVA
ncbi:MAG: enoyl-CoA hydratase/isomerase family protein, partial [Phyllobacteriaceae bacterium]|nr:enoyl-CoA hydratase/isomerase family protein [Phyllobacteriaceae bacterium]